MKNLSIALALVLIGCGSVEVGQELTSQEHQAGAEEGGIAGGVQDVFMGEIVYVPIYSSIFYYDHKSTRQLSAMLSIHNINLEEKIKIRKVDYYSTKGTLIRKYLKEVIELGPLETTNFVIEERDIAGGPGANFIVEWIADQAVSAPLVEAIMIGTSSTGAISLSTGGKAIKEIGKHYTP